MAAPALAGGDRASRPLARRHRRGVCGRGFHAGAPISLSIAIRVDASNLMGIGHLVRSLTLANVLRARGCSVQFVCRRQPGDLVSLLRNEGFEVAELPEAAGGSAVDAARAAVPYAAWLGVSEADDAAATIEVLRSPDWLIVDHYGIGAAWHRALRPHVQNLAVIDDLADRSYDCDVLIDQNFHADPAARYHGRVPGQCRTLLGPRFALLKPEYSAARAGLRARSGEVERVLVFFGGSDPQDLTGITLRTLCQPEFAHVAVDVVVGVNNPHRRAVTATAAARPRTRCLESLPHLAGLMVEADLAVGAGGGTVWERLCVGLPTIIVSIAANQTPACRALGADDLVRFLGESHTLAPTALPLALQDALADPERNRMQSLRGMALVDGLGALRVAETLAPAARAELTLRDAVADDVGTYFTWANDREVRQQAKQSDAIPMAQHVAWFGKRLASPDSHLFVLMAGRLPVGQIRFDRHDERTFIDYSIDAPFRGRGWAALLVELGVQRMTGRYDTLCAEVKATNPRSAAVFARLGFREQPPAQGLRQFTLQRPAAARSTGT